MVHHVCPCIRHELYAQHSFFRWVGDSSSDGSPRLIEVEQEEILRGGQFLAAGMGGRKPVVSVLVQSGVQGPHAGPRVCPGTLTHLPCFSSSLLSHLMTCFCPHHIPQQVGISVALCLPSVGHSSVWLMPQGNPNIISVLNTIEGRGEDRAPVSAYVVPA